MKKSITTTLFCLVLTLISFAQMGLRQLTQNGATPLMEAINDGDFTQVKNLIVNGADVNQVVWGDGTALIVAAQNGELAIVKYLFEKGAEVNQAVLGDGNPLINAAKFGHLDVVGYLFENGADVNAVVKGDETPLCNAAKMGHLAIVKYLVAQGADINWQTKVYEVKWKSVQYTMDDLTNMPTDELAQVTEKYRSAISLAKENGHTKIVDFLTHNK